jgi:hypothetical protein
MLFIKRVKSWTKWRKANWIGHVLRRNCLLKHVTGGKIEGRVEVTGRRGRRRKQLLDDLMETRGYWKLKEEALDRSVWRTRFGRGCGPCRKADCGIGEWLEVLTEVCISDVGKKGDRRDTVKFVRWTQKNVTPRSYTGNMAVRTNVKTLSRVHQTAQQQFQHLLMFMSSRDDTCQLHLLHNCRINTEFTTHTQCL